MAYSATQYSRILKNWRVCLRVVIIMTFAPQQIAHADTVTLINGDHFTGKLMEQAGGRLVFRTEYAGVIRVKWKHVKSLKTEQPALLLFDNGDTKSVVSVEITGQDVTYLDSGDRQLHTMDAEVIVGISPESWLANESGEWSGFANLSVKSDRGNGDADYVDLDADITYRRRSDRFRLGSEWEHDTKVVTKTGETRTTKNKWNIRGNYDYFFNKNAYVTALAAFERDELADINLRSSVGPLFGYQFYESRPLNLLTEAGLLWVDEDYIGAEDDRFWKPAWRVHFDKYIFEGNLQFYHEHFGAVRANDTDNWLINSRTGFRVPITRGMLVSVEYKLDYDNSPINDNDSTESTVRLKLGYKW